MQRRSVVDLGCGERGVVPEGEDGDEAEGFLHVPGINQLIYNLLSVYYSIGYESMNNLC